MRRVSERERGERERERGKGRNNKLFVVGEKGSQEGELSRLQTPPSQ